MIESLGPDEEKDLDAEQITHLLKRWQDGDDLALEQIIVTVYDKLKSLAKGELNREYYGSGLCTTELLNEAFILLYKKSGIDWQSRQHFYNIASLAMRRFLLDYAKRRHAKRRGGPEAKHFSLEKEELLLLPDEKELPDIIAVNQVLEEIESQDETLARVVTMKYFAGYQNMEVADILGISLSTVKRKWEFAKVYLNSRLSPRASV